MEADLPAIHSYAIQKRPTVKERAKDATPIVLFFFGCFFVGMLFPFFMCLMPSFLLGTTIVHFVFIFLVGACLGLGTVLIVRAISRGMFGGDKRKVEELEKRLLSHKETTYIMTDLDALISENLKMKRPQVAEFYSRQLLAISEKVGETECTPGLEMMLACSAWVSTPAYHKTINYWLIWLFETRGTLSLTNEFFEYESNRISFRLAVEDIVDIGIENHPWWLKPMPMHYIRMTYRNFGSTETLYLTPYNMQTDTVWDVNHKVKEWYSHLTKALQKVC